MIIRCTKCSTEFALDPSQVGPEGVTLRCSVCSHMFHAEPDPDAMPAPWKLTTVEKHLSTLPDLRRVLEQVADGRLRPDDRISRTGTSWIKLGELPELSALFIGAEGLPRVFKAAEVAPVTDLGPPPAFGAGVDEVRREETVRFNLNALGGSLGSGSGVRSPRVGATEDDPLPAPPEFDTALPAPPDFDTPVSRRGRGPGVPDPRAFPAIGLEGRGNAGSGNRPASMLEAVTKAVSGGEERGRDVPETIESSRLRSQPILVADLARAAAASAEKAVQAVDGQRARERERAERAERATGTFTGAMQRVEPTRETPGPGRDGRSETRPRPDVRTETRQDTRGAGHREPTTTRAEPRRDTAELKQGGRVEPRRGDTAELRRDEQRRGDTAEPRRDEQRRGDTAEQRRGDTSESRRGDTTEQRSQGAARTAELKLAAAAARSAELRMLAEREAEPTPLPDKSPEDTVAGDTAELTRPPEVVIVKVAEGRSSAPLWGLLGIAAAAGIVFGVPSIREKVFNLGASAPVTKVEPDATPKTAASDVPTQELAQARAATRNLGLKETNKVQAALQRVIDDPKRSPAAVDQARVAQAELVLMRALACKIAVTIEPTALGGQAQTRAAEDPEYATELLAAVGEGADGDALRRVQVLQALVQGQPLGTLPANSDELAALIKGAPLWRGEARTPPAGLITALQRVANPSTLTQSVLALALWRSGDVEGAQALLRGVIEKVADQPAASTILEAIDRQNLVTENGDPEVAVPPSDPEDEPATPPQPGTPTAPGTPPDTKNTAIRPPSPGEIAQERVEVMISTGCQKVRQGDPAGVQLLLAAVDRGADPMQNFNLCFCLGAGFSRANIHDSALTWYKRAIQQSPSNRDAVAGAARSAELLGRTSVAVDYYKRLRNLDPGNAAANAYLAKHEESPEPAPTQPPEEPGELMPVKRKSP